MSWTWKQILGFGITAFLVMTLIFAAGTGLVAKTQDAHSKTNTRIDQTTDSYK